MIVAVARRRARAGPGVRTYRAPRSFFYEANFFFSVIKTSYHRVAKLELGGPFHTAPQEERKVKERKGIASKGVHPSIIISISFVSSTTQRSIILQQEGGRARIRFPTLTSAAEES